MKRRPARKTAAKVVRQIHAPGVPLGAKVVAILYFIQSVMALIGAFALLLSATFVSALADAGFGELLTYGASSVALIFFLISALLLLVGWGIWTIKGWARIIATVFSALSIISIRDGLLSALIGAFVILLLWFHPETRAAFSKKAN